MNVDPYTQPLPKEITDKDGKPTREFQSWLVYDNIWKFNMWTRSGGASDAIVDGSQEFNYLAANATLRAKIIAAETRIIELENTVSGFVSLNAKLEQIISNVEASEQELHALKSGLSNATQRIEKQDKEIGENVQNANIIKSIVYGNKSALESQKTAIDNIRQVI